MAWLTALDAFRGLPSPEQWANAYKFSYDMDRQRLQEATAAKLYRNWIAGQGSTGVNALADAARDDAALAQDVIPDSTPPAEPLPNALVNALAGTGPGQSRVPNPWDLGYGDTAIPQSVPREIVWPGVSAENTILMSRVPEQFDPTDLARLAAERRAELEERAAALGGGITTARGAAGQELAARDPAVRFRNAREAFEAKLSGYEQGLADASPLPSPPPAPPTATSTAANNPVVQQAYRSLSPAMQDVIDWSQPFGPQMAAVQAHAQMVGNTIQPFIDSLVQSGGNPQLQAALVDRLRQTGNPILADTAKYLEVADFRKPGEVWMSGPRLQSMTDEQLAAIGLSRDAVDAMGPKDQQKFTMSGGVLVPGKIEYHKTKSAPRQYTVELLRGNKDLREFFGVSEAMLKDGHPNDTIEFTYDQEGEQWAPKYKPWKEAVGQKDTVEFPATVEAIDARLNDPKYQDPNVQQSLKEWKDVVSKYDSETKRHTVMQVKVKSDGTVTDVTTKPTPPPAKAPSVTIHNVPPSYQPTERRGWRDMAKKFVASGSDPKFLPSVISRGRGRDPKALADWDYVVNLVEAEAGLTPEAAGATRGTVAAQDAALRKQEGAAKSLRGFVNSVDRQIERINHIAKTAPSSALPRLFALPINEAKRVIFGDSSLSAYRMYISELSAETARISGMSLANTNLPEGARKHWDKIIDNNTPLGEMLKLLGEVSQSARIRLRETEQTVKDIQKERQARLSGGSFGGKPSAPSGAQVGAQRKAFIAQATKIINPKTKKPYTTAEAIAEWERRSGNGR